MLFVNNVHGNGVIRAAQRAGAVNKFIWLASDSVSPSGDLVGIEDTGELNVRGGAGAVNK